MGPSGLLYDDPLLSDFSDLMKPWGLRREDLRAKPQGMEGEPDWTAMGDAPAPSQPGPPLNIDEQQPMEMVDFQPSLPRFQGTINGDSLRDPRMEPPQFSLGSPHPDANGERFVPSGDTGYVTSFNESRPFSEGFVGKPVPGSAGWDTLGRGVSDALGGAAYNVLSLGGEDSVATSPNLLMRPGQLSSAQLHPPVPSPTLDRAFPLSNLQAGLDLSPTSDYSEGASFTPQPSGDEPEATHNPQEEAMEGSIDLGPAPVSPQVSTSGPAHAYMNTGDNGVPTFGVSDYVTGSTGAPAIDGLNDADLARFVAQDGGGSGLSLPTAPDGFDIASVEYKPMEGNNPAQYIPHFASSLLNPEAVAKREFDLNQQGADKAMDRTEYLKQVQADLDAQNRAIEIGDLKDAGFYNRVTNGAAMAGVEDRGLAKAAELAQKQLAAAEYASPGDPSFLTPERRAQLQSVVDAAITGLAQPGSASSALPTTSAGVEAVRGATSKQIAAAVAEWEKSNPGRQPTPAEKDAIRQRALSFR